MSNADLEGKSEVNAIEEVDPVEDVAPTEETNPLEKAEQLLQDAAWLRRVRSKTSTISGLIILGLFLFLAIDTYHYIANYRADRVAEHIQEQLPALSESMHMKNLMKSVQNVVLPAYVDELTDRIKQSEPLLKAECLSAIQSIMEDAGPAVQQKVLEDMRVILEETRSDLLDRYPDLTEDEIVVILHVFRAEIERQYPQRISEQVGSMFATVDQSLKKLRQTDMYDELSEERTDALERRLITSALELLIYEIDPNSISTQNL